MPLKTQYILQVSPRYEVQCLPHSKCNLKGPLNYWYSWLTNLFKNMLTCVLTVATLRRKALMLSVISGPTTDPSNADKAEAGGLMATSHDREFLTINLMQNNHQKRKWQDKLLYPSLSPHTPHTKPSFIFPTYVSLTNSSVNKVYWRNNKWAWYF